MKRGFTLNTLLIDGQFDHLTVELAEMGITLNTVSRREHVLGIERHIRTIKNVPAASATQYPFSISQDEWLLN